MSLSLGLQALPFFFVMVFMEHFYMVLCEGKPGINFKDGIMSVSHGIIMSLRE